MACTDEMKRNPPNELRAAAQQLLEDSNPTMEINADLTAVVHELRVHQIELEMQNEELLRAYDEADLARQKAERLFEEAPVGYLVLDENGIIQRANIYMDDLVGPGGRPLIRRSVHQLFEPASQPVLQAKFAALREDPEGQYMEVQIRAALGPRWMALTAQRYEHEGQVSLRLILTDIHARKKAEDARELSDRRRRSVADEYRALVDAVPDFITVVGAKGQVRLVNRSVAEARRGGRSEFIGIAYEELWPERKLAETPDSLVEAALSTGELQEGTALRLKDLVCEVRAIPILDAQGAVTRVIEICQDVTERRSLEHRLQQAQRQESLGRLAGGIAHDFNNILTGILGNAELAFESPAEVQESLQNISAEANRAAALTKQLLAFSRRQPVEPQAIDLSSFVREALQILRRILGDEVGIETDLAQSPVVVRADPHQLEQVLMNLMINARDAMPAGGTVHVRLRRVQAQAHSANDIARISVKDFGTGIEPELLTQIFDPFFTTKVVGKGTGLGLSTAFGIVSEHGGWLDVHSTVGEGTTFEVNLPCTNEPAVPTQVLGHRDMRRRRTGTETILLAEDEPRVRELTAKILRRHGYTVIVACDGLQALHAAQVPDAGIDIVVTDVRMPSMGGPELCQHLWEVRPTLKVLFLSGYPGVDASSDEAGLPAPLLRKPFTSDGLLDQVRAILDGPGRNDPV